MQEESQQYPATYLLGTWKAECMLSFVFANTHLMGQQEKNVKGLPNQIKPNNKSKCKYFDMYLQDIPAKSNS